MRQELWRQFANPNNKMSKEGIAKVADQLIGIQNMKTARANHLSPAQNDAGQYLSANKSLIQFLTLGCSKK